MKRLPGVTPGWAAQAACLGTDPKMWWDPTDVDKIPPGNKPIGRPQGKKLDAQLARCQQVCARCPVRVDCITEGAVLVDRGTIRGGLRMWDRRDYRKACLIAQDVLGARPVEIRRKLGMRIDPEDLAATG